MVVIIIQARMGSTRLPGKVLKRIAGRPMLGYQIERLRRVKLAQRMVVATTVADADDAIVNFCVAERIPSTRGSELDVLSRYCDAAREMGATLIVRVTGDCPLIDPDVIDKAIATFLAADRLTFLSNMLEQTWPLGMAVEVVTAAALFEANCEARDPWEREHVMPFIYNRPDRFRLMSLTMTPDLSHHRWTVDTPEDFELVRRILETLHYCKSDFNMRDVLALLEAHPDWVGINAMIRQKSPVPFVGNH